MFLSTHDIAESATTKQFSCPVTAPALPAEPPPPAELAPPSVIDAGLAPADPLRPATLSGFIAALVEPPASSPPAPEPLASKDEPQPVNASIPISPDNSPLNIAQS